MLPMRVMFFRKLHTTTRVRKQIPKNLKGKSVTAQKWLTRQLNDPYVKLAKVESYRCRSAFKLVEIDDRFRLLKPGQVVVDCGAAPGSWSQVAVSRVNALGNTEGQAQGTVVGIDLQHMNPVDGATILGESDFTHIDTQKELVHLLKGSSVDVVLSDMAPSPSGLRSLDHDQIIELCLAVFKFSLAVLGPGGTLLCKLWTGGQQDKLQGVLKQAFDNVRLVKPQASRTDSAEAFMLARNFKGRTNIIR